MNIHKNQQGFVSIVVTMIIIVLVTMVTLGFAFLARQNQRQSLNRQLSTQAFYAAESGVNDAAANLGTLGNVTNCNTVGGTNATLDAKTDTKYTCVLIDQAPTSLVYDSISNDSSTIVHIQTPQPVNHLRISWQDAGNDSGFAASGGKFYLPQAKVINGAAVPGINSQTATFPNHTGVLRATIIPASAATSTDNLLTASQTVFMYPEGHVSPGNAGGTPFRTAGNANSAAGLGAEGVFVSGACNTGNGGTNPLYVDFPRYCNAEINYINSNNFYLRLKSVYKPVAVTIQAQGASGEMLEMTGAQAVVDSTGKSVDVLRRIQVRLPLEPSYYFPEFAIESANTICKRLVAWNDGAEVLAPANYIYDISDSLSGQEINDKQKDREACQLPGQGLPNF